MIITDYMRRLRKLESDKDEELLDSKRHKAEIKFKMIGLEAERTAIQKMVDDGEITGELGERIEHTMNQMEMIMSSRFKMVVMVSWIRLRRLLTKQFYKKSKNLQAADLQKLKQIRITSSKAAITAIQSQMNDSNRASAMKAIEHYKQFITRMEQQDMSRAYQDEWFNEQKNELQIAAIQAERNEIQHMFERGEINRAYAVKLRQYINYQEAGILYSDLEEE
ncbi:Sodium, potassium, lithium and rubidium/H(+) antiporter [compost metagenome]